MRRERELLKNIERALRKAGLTFERQPSVGGLRPDLLVHGPDKQVVVVEAKAWPSTGGHTARARSQAEWFRDVTGADQAFVVVDELKRNYPNEGVVSPEGLIPALTEFFARASRRERRPKLNRQPAKRLVFAAMPFARRYDDTFFVAMTHAAESVNAACRRVDRTEFVGDVVEETKRLIRSSIAVIVDLSESKPNVLYEAGFAHALGKPAVHICSTALDELPFDVRNWNTIEYGLGQTVRLRTPLRRRLKSALEG